MSWQLIATSRAGVAYGEVTDATSREIHVGLSVMGGASFTVRATHPLADTLIDGEALICVYQRTSETATAVLRMVCEIVTAEESIGGDAGSVAVTCAEAGFYRLQHRLVGRSAAGFNNGTAATPVNRATIAAAVIDEVNGGWSTGVIKGAMSSGGTTAINGATYKPAMELLTELALATDGYDFVFDPLAPSTGNVASFRCAPTIGSTQTEAIFEYGTGQRNVTSYKRQISRDGLTNFVYAMPPGFPDNTSGSVVQVSDSPSILARGVWEAIIPTDLVTDTARTTLCTEHVAVRKQARQRIDFVPGDAAPVYGVHYAVGDTVTARAEHPANTIRFNSTFRVYGVSVTIDDNGREAINLTLIADL